MEGEVWAGHADRLGGEAVEQICGSVEPFYPVARRNKSLKKQRTQHIIDGAEDALGFYCSAEKCRDKTSAEVPLWWRRMRERRRYRTHGHCRTGCL
jgi:hypothetical protein